MARRARRRLAKATRRPEGSRTSGSTLEKESILGYDKEVVVPEVGLAHAYIEVNKMAKSKKQDDAGHESKKNGTDSRLAVSVPRPASRLVDEGKYPRPIRGYDKESLTD